MELLTGEWAFGENLENIYTQDFFFCFVLTVLFGDFELIRDIKNRSDK